jgi:hypothetical protein
MKRKSSLLFQAVLVLIIEQQASLPKTSQRIGIVKAGDISPKDRLPCVYRISKFRNNQESVQAKVWSMSGMY